MTKRHLHSLAFVSGLLLLVGSACVAYVVGGDTGPRSGPPRATATVGFFFDELSPYGTWLEVEIYGWVWVPNGVPAGWRPYTHGRWVYTSYGWTWISDWAWGWAPFHYGRWARHRERGWIWIPGRVWAPAWVAWRVGDGWIGWAPFPPQVGWRMGVGLDLGDFDLKVAIAPESWVFVGEHQFLEQGVHARIADSHRNSSYLGRTRDVTRYVADGRGAAERGLEPQRLEAVLGKPIARYHVEEASRPPARPGSVREGTVQIYRPDARETQDRTPRRGRGRKPPRE